MKTQFAIVLALLMSTACVSGQNRSTDPTNQSTTEAAGPGTSRQPGLSTAKAYNASIKGSGNIAAATNLCAAEIRKIPGIKVTQILTSIGVISLRATDAQKAKVAALACVKSVEKDSIVSTSENPGPTPIVVDDLFNYIATVTGDTKACADQMRKTRGVQIGNIMEAIGVISFSASPANRDKIAKLSCIAAVEDDGIVHADPSTRIGN